MTISKKTLLTILGLITTLAAIVTAVLNGDPNGGQAVVAGSGGVVALAGRGGAGGVAVVVVGGAGRGGASGGAAGVPAVVVAPSRTLVVGVNGWYIGTDDWGFGIPWSSSKPSFAVGSNPWSDKFLSDLQPYGSYRFLEYVGTNYSKVTSWSQRRGQTDAGNVSPYVDGDTVAVTPGLAYEWVFDLCNRTGKQCWVTLPVLADDNYISQFVTLARAQLKTRLIIEISNEVSGGWFGQTAQAAKTAGYTGSDKGLQARAAVRYVVQRSVFAAKQIRLQGVNGEVVACGVASADILRSALVSDYANSGEKFGAVCMSAYFGNGRDGNTYALAQAKSDIDALETGEDGMITYQAIGKTYGLPVYAYEGGLHVLKNAAVFAAKSDAGVAESYLLDAASRHLAIFNHYTDASTWPTAEGKGAWGLKPTIGGADTFRSTAVKAWVVNHKN